MVEIRALSVTQPWASLIAASVKRIETRDWDTSHRGLLAIQATKSMPLEASKFAARKDIKALLQCEPEQLPHGAIVAIVYLHDTYLILKPPNDDTEAKLGNYNFGRFGWVFDGVYKLPTPIPARGLQGLWKWDAPSAVSVAAREYLINLMRR